MYRSFFKPLIDFLSALFGLMLLSPLILLLFVFLKIANKGDAFFFQQRPGKNGKIFKIVKFKTMTDQRNAEGELLPDAQRLTKIGTFVRSTSLDEIPQLFNVLIGDMSLIGPRPLLPEYMKFYNAFQNRRHEVKPGITGWAQVNGRNAISWDKKFEMDVWYVDHTTFLQDLKIIRLTIKKIIKTDGISAEGHVTMPRFDNDK